MVNHDSALADQYNAELVRRLQAEAALEQIDRIVSDPGLWSAFSARRLELQRVLAEWMKHHPEAWEGISA